jgi:phage terminase small subunit
MISKKYNGSSPLKNFKQEKFAIEFLKDFSCKQAAIRAGYSKKTADKLGSRALSNPDVLKRINYHRNKLTRKQEVTVEYIIQGIKDIADDEEASNKDKLKAFELLGKYRALFTERRIIEEKPKRIIIRAEDATIAEEIK